jgi:predicted aldo/keto reductase-like oxidoreductase
MSTRRDFLRAATAAAVLSPAMLRGQSDKLGKLLPLRDFGGTGVKVTAFGLGGKHVGDMDDEKLAAKIIDHAIERGVRFFDNAASYKSGRAESYYGKFLSPRYREHVFITTKSSKGSAQAARQDFEDSLRRLNTDYIDLWQLHAFKNVDDVKHRIDNGAVDVFLEMREKKRARFIGFTGHSSQAAHVYFIDWCAKRGIQMDSCLMPVNVFDPHYDSFLLNVEPKLRENNIALQAMKTMVYGRVFNRKDAVDPKLLTPEVLHGFVYSLPVACLVSGCETTAQIDSNTAVLENFKPMEDGRREELVAMAKPHSGADMEFYKGGW